MPPEWACTGSAPGTPEAPWAEAGAGGSVSITVSMSGSPAQKLVRMRAAVVGTTANARWSACSTSTVRISVITKDRFERPQGGDRSPQWHATQPSSAACASLPQGVPRAQWSSSQRSVAFVLRRDNADGESGGMPEKSPHTVVFSEEPRKALERQTGAHSGSYRDVVRAEAILLAADGLSNTEIAGGLECSHPSVSS